jgi:hypothetical protein
MDKGKLNFIEKYSFIKKNSKIDFLILMKQKYDGNLDKMSNLRVSQSSYTFDFKLKNQKVCLVLTQIQGVFFIFTIFFLVEIFFFFFFLIRELFLFCKSIFVFVLDGGH